MSLSDELKNIYEKETSRAVAGSLRRDLQDFGDKLRKEKGTGFLAEEVVKKITNSESSESKLSWVIDSIKNPCEIDEIRKHFPNRFFLFGIYADKEERWERVKKKIDYDRKSFDQDDSNDSGSEKKLPYGQRVTDCFLKTDVIIKNDKNISAIENEEFKNLQGKVSKYVYLIEHAPTGQQPISKNEAVMAMAYTASIRSSCLQRKVGAVIVDEFGNAISSGYNEVPGFLKPCESEYKECYRKKKRRDFKNALGNLSDDIGRNSEQIIGLMRSEFKNLDICRALHAEENAIINLVRNGRTGDLGNCTLFSTTYPCRLCANKIVNSGIKKIVYFEPYPDQTSMTILNENHVKQESFEGVTFNAYFRIYGERKDEMPEM